MYIYIYIKQNVKKTKEIYILLFRSNFKQKKYAKLKISNSIQYNPQKATFQTVNKFFSCYINYILPQL